MSKSYIVEAEYKASENGIDFEINLEIPANRLNIRGFTKNLLINNEVQLSKEHAIYILEGDNLFYVGQTKNLASRIKTHKGNNKIEFKRCFILSQKGNDLRQYLDFMEGYTISEMKKNGYELENTQCPSPDEDMLTNFKKEIAKGWVNDFLNFLPLLGLDKTNTTPTIITSLETPEKEVKTTKEVIGNNFILKVNNTKIEANSRRKVIIELAQYIGLEKIIKTNKFNNNVFSIRKELQKTPQYYAETPIKEHNKTYYVVAHFSAEECKRQILKLAKTFNLNVEFVNF